MRKFEQAAGREHRKIHFVHDRAEDRRERSVCGISAMSDPHEAQLWSKARGIEKNPTAPQKGFDIGVKIRRDLFEERYLKCRRVTKHFMGSLH